MSFHKLGEHYYSWTRVGRFYISLISIEDIKFSQKAAELDNGPFFTRVRCCSATNRRKQWAQRHISKKVEHTVIYQQIMSQCF